MNDSSKTAIVLHEEYLPLSGSQWFWMWEIESLDLLRLQFLYHVQIGNDFKCNKSDYNPGKLSPNEFL